MQLARRWAGPAAQAAGIVETIKDEKALLAGAQARAAELAPLARDRNLYRAQKEALFGEQAVLNQPHGAAYLLRNLERYP